MLLRRDGGRCAQCGMECERIRRLLWPDAHNTPSRRLLVRIVRDEQLGLPTPPVLLRLWLKWRRRARLLRWLLRESGYRLNRNRTLWEADHIRAVSEGGGPEAPNLRVLCLVCHRQETLALRARRAKR